MAAYAEIEVIGARRSERIWAVVDTGFDVAVCLPVSIAVTLGGISWLGTCPVC